jgi:hypothetical protein
MCSSAPERTTTSKPAVGSRFDAAHVPAARPRRQQQVAGAAADIEQLAVLRSQLGEPADDLAVLAALVPIFEPAERAAVAGVIVGVVVADVLRCRPWIRVCEPAAAAADDGETLRAGPVVLLPP